jgi:uncharacterized SAM-binding protein YcdF (DUF218 family)
MFLLSKLMSLFTQPLAWVALLLLLTMLGFAGRRRWAAPTGWSALVLLMALGWEPLPDHLLRTLESRYPAVAQGTDLRAYVGVVLLGGALEPAYVWQGHDQPALNEAAERMTVALPLMRQHPHLKLLFTGGEGELLGSGLTEAERARRFFQAMGLPEARLLLEYRSRNTYENAVMSAAMPGIDHRQPWLLLTSAWHMPRAMASFEKAGWNVRAYPVDFRSGQATAWTRYSLANGVRKWQTALHEMLGLLSYRLAGRS